MITSRSRWRTLLSVIAASLPTPETFHLNAKSPDALMLADRFPLKARDVVLVDAARFVRWSRAIHQILPSISILNRQSALASR